MIRNSGIILATINKIIIVQEHIHSINGWSIQAHRTDYINYSRKIKSSANTPLFPVNLKFEVFAQDG